MQAQLLPQIAQPVTHTSNSHMREYFLCRDYSLTFQEQQTFCNLAQRCNVLFEPPNERWDLLKELSRLYFGVEVQGRQWLKLGFQGQYPETDFRGGGVMALELIVRFVRNHKPIAQRMQCDAGGFFFAITAINIAFFMKKYFHLANFLVPHRDNHIYCSRRALKNFCRLITSQAQVYEKMHGFLLKHFYEKQWLGGREDGGQLQPIQQGDNVNNQQHLLNHTPLLNFNSLFEELNSRLARVFSYYDLEGWGQFENAWRTEGGSV